MFEKYMELNDWAKDYLLLELDKITEDKNELERIKKEIDILYERSILFVIEFLYRYKKTNEKAKFHFRGMINNLLILYKLGLNEVDPIKYNLPYELYFDRTVNIDFINIPSASFVIYLQKFPEAFKVVKGSFEKDDIEEINELEDNHYLILPYSEENMTFRLNEFNEFETIEDYRLFKNEVISIKLDDKHFINDDQISLNNALNSEFEYNVAKILKPKTIEEYTKVISLAHSTRVWKDNQDKLFENKKITLNNLIASREDIYEYLIEHNIDSTIAVDIIRKIIRRSYASSDELWNNYIKIMKEHNCDETFIEIINKIVFIFGRGQAVSECLYALDKDNYYKID